MNKLKHIFHIFIIFWCIFYYIDRFKFLKFSISKPPHLFVYYCQYLEEKLVGTEYPKVDKNKSEISLKGLIITTRHGERLPLIKTSANSFPCKAYQREQQKNFEKYAKYVNSYDFKNFIIPDKEFHGFPWNPSESECEAGNMTVEGALQIIRLGEYLTKVYKNSGIFNGTQIFISSTTNYRTFQSSIAFIYSFLFQIFKNDFYHGSKYLNIKASNQTVFCNDNFDCYCKRIPKLRAEYEKDHSQMFYQNYPKLREKINRIANSFSIPPFSIPLQFFDIILGGYACRRQALPCFSNNFCVSMQLLNNSLNATNELFQTIFAKYKNYFAIEAYAISNNVVKLIKEQRSNPNSKKVIQFYSGHRTTLMPFIYIFGLNVSNIVPVYASRLIFEIYHSKNPIDNESIFIRILLNGFDYTSNLSFCQPSKMYIGMCHGKAFEQFVEKVLYPNILDIC